MTWRQNSILRHWYVQSPSCRTLSIVKCMSIVRMAELFSASRFRPMSEWQKSVHRQGGLKAELCLVSGVCAVTWRQKSVLRQGYVQWPGGRFLLNVTAIIIVREANSVQGQGHIPDPGQSFASRPLDIPLTQVKVLPSGLLTYPNDGHSSATQILDIPQTQDRALSLGHLTYS
ncbi:hypothetical protein TNCV_4516141 [Trichonephila clavipes]|nr:hypothetical protein TNCV_4516141 [Trichonephila clavipes]